MTRATLPTPLATGDLAGIDGSDPSPDRFRAQLEELLLALPDDRVDRLMQLLRESRAAWFPMLRSGTGELLFLGNALSGAVTPLAAFGFRVTQLELSPERARFAAFRNQSNTPGQVQVVLGGDAARLPFQDRAFDVVVCEDGLPSLAGTTNGYRFPFDECLRVARGEVVLVADNRLAYKRSGGRRGEFHVPGPLEYARRALRPERGERTLAGYRRVFAARGFDRPRAFALYPHASDYSHVVALDAPVPALTIGPMERKNRAKLAGRALGLFPVLTPSFALIAGRRGSVPATTRVERMLAQIAESIGEPTPEVEQLVGTRGNDVVLHTKLPGDSEDEPAGRWTLHVPLAPKNQPQLEHHYRMLELMRARFPSVPVPEPLWVGRADGVPATCERRVPGWTAPQHSGNRSRIARMLREVSAHLASLVARPCAPLTEDAFEIQIAQRFEAVMRHASVPTTIARMRRLLDETREKLIGKPIPLVVYHGDLRTKHVQIDLDGRVLGLLDWGTSELEGPPYFDLLHLVIHERKQTEDRSPADAWRIIRERDGLREEERAALDDYMRAVGIDEETQRAIEAIYPVLVAAVAETHWDYSRPRWLHRQFGI